MSLALPIPPAWVAQALCIETDNPEEFFPEKGGSSRQAKAVCRRCDVREQCLEYALERQERFGIWGGLSERERRKLGQARRPATQDPERLAYIRRLRDSGMSNAAIATRLGMSRPNVSRLLRLTSAASDQPTQSQVRAWARTQGIDVNSHGNIPHTIRDAYIAAHRGDAA